MTVSLEELRKLLENRPYEVIEWFSVFEAKFSALQKQLQETSDECDSDLQDYLKQTEGIPLEKQDVNIRIGKAVKFALGEFIDRILGDDC